MSIPWIIAVVTPVGVAAFDFLLICLFHRAEVLRHSVTPRRSA